MDPKLSVGDDTGSSESVSARTVVLAVGGSALLGLTSYSIYSLYNYLQLSKLPYVNLKLINESDKVLKPWTSFSKRLRVRIINLDGTSFFLFFLSFAPIFLV